MDIATLVGLITCGVMVFLGIVTGPEKMAGFRHFYDLTSRSEEHTSELQSR